MAIRFKYDAAAVAIPQNEARQRFGQQLVLQQQKYANDQRQTMRDQAYDQQRQFAQNAFQLQREQERRNQLGQQALADLNAKQVFGAQQADAAKIAQKQKERQAAEKAERENLARLKAQERADDEEAIKFGGYDPVTASELRKSYALDTKIDLNPDYDEAMRADAHRQNQENRRKLQESRIATPSMADRANQNLSYYVPSLQRYAKPEELQGLKQADPNIEVQVFQDGKMLPGPTPKQTPMSAQEYYRADGGMFKKDLASKMSELQGKLDAGEMTLEEGQDLRSVAWQQMQDDYNFAQQALGTNQPVQGGQAQPPQAGKPAMPPAQVPAAQQPAMGMQDLEPTYNADGTTSAPGQPAMQAPAGEPAVRPPMLGNPDATALPEAKAQPPMRVVHQDGRIFERAPDGWKEVKNVATQPIQQADGTWVQQSPVDGAWRPVAPEIQPFRPEQPAMPPARPLQPGEEDGGAAFAPRAPMVAEQPVETLPIDQTGMQPPAQNVWAEVAMPEQQKPDEKMADVATLAKKPVASAAAPDFKKLSEKMTDSEDRVVLGKLQSMYDKQTPDIQSAIGVVVDAEADKEMRAQAYLYLKSKGIDMSQLAKTKKRQLPGMSGIR